jgi:hypothetical protein
VHNTKTPQLLSRLPYSSAACQALLLLALLLLELCPLLLELCPHVLMLCARHLTTFCHRDEPWPRHPNQVTDHSGLLSLQSTRLSIPSHNVHTTSLLPHTRPSVWNSPNAAAAAEPVASVLTQQTCLVFPLALTLRCHSPPLSTQKGNNVRCLCRRFS